MRGVKRAKMFKIRLGVAVTRDKMLLDRDVVGAIDIGLKYPGLRCLPNGSPVALGLTEPHEVQVKLIILHRGLTPLIEIKMLKNN